MEDKYSARKTGAAGVGEKASVKRRKEKGCKGDSEGRDRVESGLKRFLFRSCQLQSFVRGMTALKAG